MIFQHEINDIWNEAYKQGRADALTIDMDKPMHFTDEQKAWIKNYIIINAKRQRADAIDEIEKLLLDRFTCDDLRTDWTNADIRETIHFELQQLKE